MSVAALIFAMMRPLSVLGTSFALWPQELPVPVWRT